MNDECIVYGVSDDLIEVDGALSEEWTLDDDDDGDIIAFSSGTVLLVAYTNAGMWKITILSLGAGVTIDPATDEDTNYSDRATVVLTGDKHWVIHGTEWVTA